MRQKSHLFSKQGGVLVLLLTFALNVFAQNITITGNVTEATGEPLIGVTVRIQGTTIGVITDFNGNFNLPNVSPTAHLEFSFMGMETQTIPVNNRTTINIVMQDDLALLDEVIVVGYGTMQRRHVTSSISSIRGDELPQGMGGATIATALQGRVSGMVIVDHSSPNAENLFQLRGVSSINAAERLGPLIVIDGVVGGDLRSLNQEDIQEISVLKDASAGAIFGTRAAGGVILITTRQGQEGPVRITYTGEVSTQTIRRRPDVLSAAEWREHGFEDLGASTDWYRLLVRDLPLSHRHVVTLQGGSRDARIFASFTASDQMGIAIGDARTDYSGRINLSLRALDGLVEIRTRTEYRVSDRDTRISAANASGGVGDGGGGQAFRMALRLNPTRPAFDPENPSGYNIFTGMWEYWNPLANVNLRQHGGRDTWLLADATIRLNLSQHLSAQTTLGTNRRQWQGTQFTSRYETFEVAAGRRGRAHHAFSRTEDMVFDTQINYARTIGVHDFGAVVGHSFSEINSESFNMTNFDFPVDGVGPWDMGRGTWLTASPGRAEMYSNKRVRERLLAGFARVNYAFDNRYMATATIRREGSSKFGANNRWGTFWSLSGGWRISAEEFMDNVSWVNDLRFRIGYGVTGNNNFAPGHSTAMFAADQPWLLDGTWEYTFGTVRNVNPDLRWEETAELNFGIDYSLFNNRVFGKFDIFRRHIDGMLMPIRVPQPPMVHPTMMMNFGNMTGRGWEFEVGGHVVQNRDFTYTTSMRFSHQNTTVTSLMGHGTYLDRMGFPSPGHPGYAVRIEEGSRIGQFHIFKHAGFDNQGGWLIYNQYNEVIPATERRNEDRRFVGNAIPDVMIAWDHNIRWRNWDASLLMRSWIGHDVFNMMEMYFGLPTIEGVNLLRCAFGRNAHITEPPVQSSFFLQDGTFLKIDALSIGYQFDVSRVDWLQRARVYLTVRNLATFTRYRGMNPEVDTTGLEPGFERFWQSHTIFPQTRHFTFGTQITI